MFKRKLITVLLASLFFVGAVMTASQAAPKPKAPAKKPTQTKTATSAKSQAPAVKLFSTENMELLKTGTPEEITAAIKAGNLSVNDITDEGANAIMYASDKNPDPKVVLALIEARVNVNYKNKNGVSVLMWTTDNKHPEVINALLDAGAKIEDRDNSGRSVSFWAMRNPNLEIAQKFLNYGKVNDSQKDGITRLMFAASNNPNTEVVKFLVDSGADINATDSTGMNALMWAAMGKTSPAQTINYLLDCGMNIEARSKVDKSHDGINALMLAVDKNNLEKASTLLACGANINSRTVKRGMTPIMFVQSPEMLQLLLDRGALLNTYDKNGYNAAYYACLDNRPASVISALLNAGAIFNKDALNKAIDNDELQNSEVYWTLNDMFHNLNR